MKTYQCICGKIFDNPQKFNGHKSNCKIHQQHKYGSLEKLNDRNNKCAQIGYEAFEKINKKRKEQKQKVSMQWIKEQHTCKTCGKVMTEYYGSGLYCSRSCANKRNLNDETKQKIINTTKKLKNAKYCLDCSKKLKSSNKSGYCRSCYRNHRIINETTRHKLSESAIRRNFGGFNFRNKGIYYNGLKLDSSYEVTVAKSLDNNNIKWIRPKSIYYIDNTGKRRRYIPDFYLPDYNVYLDPKNDYLINSINKSLGYSDVDKINWVMQQNNVKIIILNKNQLEWKIIKTLI